MNTWLNPYGSLWSTPTFGGRFFTADSEAVYSHSFTGGKCGNLVNTGVTAERFPSTTEGVHHLMSVLKDLVYTVDAVRDEFDTHCVHEALGLLVDGEFSDISVYDGDRWMSLAHEYLGDVEDVLSLLCKDLRTYVHSSEGAKAVVMSWKDSDAKYPLSVERLLEYLDEM